MLLEQDQQGANDLSKHRVIDLDNGNKVHLERRDPYGFIHVWLDKGQFPDKSILNGVFTDWHRAYTAVDAYVHERNAAVSQIRHIHPTEIKETVGQMTGVIQKTPDYTVEATTELGTRKGR